MTTIVLLSEERTKRSVLREHGWIPFMELRGRCVWVGPNGELETTRGAMEYVTRESP